MRNVSLKIRFDRNFDRRHYGMGQQLTTSLHIESVGVLEQKDLVVLSHAFDGLKPVIPFINISFFL